MIPAEHGILYVTDKIQSANAARQLLAKVGHTRFFAACTLREMNECIMRDLPHILIVEANLPECGAIEIIKKIRADVFLARMVIMLIRKPTKEEILECVNLRVSAILPAPVDPVAFVEKTKALMTALKGNSPYAIALPELQGGINAFMYIPAVVCGRTKDHLVAQAPLVSESGSRFSLKPSDSKLPPANVTYTGLVEPQFGKDPKYNVFALDSIVGKGRGWVHALGIINTEKQPKKRVLLQENSREKAKQVIDLLSVHQIEVVHADTIQRMTQLYSADSDGFQCVLITETPTGSTGIAWSQYLSEIPQNKRPTQIIITSAASPAVKPDTIWLRKPFGIDGLLSCLETAFCQHAAAAISDGVSTGKKVNCDYVVPGQIRVFDEEGIVLGMPIHPALGTQVNLHHAFIANEGLGTLFKVVKVVPDSKNKNMWYVKLISLESDSRSKRWRLIREKFAATKVAPVQKK